MLPVPPPNCPSNCGKVDIPYPFGIGASECFRAPTFELTCDETTNPPGLYSGDLLVANISMETAEITVYYRGLTSTCNDPDNRTAPPSNVGVRLRSGTAFLISTAGNTFTAVGCGAEARINGNYGTYRTGCMTYCARASESAGDGTPCRGNGCCEASLTADLKEFSVKWVDDFKSPAFNPCQYAFVAKNGWYSFNKSDLTGNMTFSERYKQGTVPIVFDWAIRDGTCTPPSDGSDEAKPVVPSACISKHSSCANARNGPGYFCICDEGYAGNPYTKDGCTNINECDHLISPNSTFRKKSYPCHGGTCQDVEGGYNCKCSFGRTGDGKSDKGCEAIVSLAAIAAIGTISGISLLAVLLLFLHMDRQRRKLRDHFNRNGGQLLKSIKIEIFTKEKLDQITKNYSHIIGRGNFGKVYKGTTSDNVQVAVKRSIAINEDRRKDLFANEITIQSQVSHKNLVQLLGCCLESEVPMLVYEFIPRGSLYDVLHGKDGTGRTHPLPLGARLDIAIYSADGLAYMHSEASHKILHGDVKTGNILLDDEFVPKVSDFGTCRLMSIGKEHTNFVIGDSSYIDPVYMKTGLLTEKSDVYSFGIVLLELITGKMARYDKNNSLPLNYIKAFKDGTTKQMLDTDIASTDEDINCLEMVGRVAVKCLEVDVNDRPTMAQVMQELKMQKIQWLHSHDKIGDAEICTTSVSVYNSHLQNPEISVYKALLSSHPLSS